MPAGHVNLPSVGSSFNQIQRPLIVQHQGVTPHNNNFVTQHNSSEGRYARERTDTEDVKIEFRNSEFAIS